MLELLTAPGIGPGASGLLLVVSLLTSATTAAFGLGGGLVMLAVLGLYLPIALLIPIHGLVQLGSNVGRVAMQWRKVAWWAVWPFLAGSILGAAIGAQFVVALPEAMLQIALGLFILVLTYVPLPKAGRMGRLGFAGFGIFMTILSMFFGATGPVNAGVFAQTFDDRETMVGTMAATTSIQHALKGAAFFSLGVAFGPYLPLTIAMVATGFLGTMLGTRVLKRLDETWFRRILKGVLTVLALDFLRRGLFGH
ncbi:MULTISPECIES: sulfite exporter TauE/SafE family protein [unclassified Aureimonas]|uniref:sulfite exporter TauE/SafE family protein n=1 Tax=unclassified Aureimonas TaxID=2615206 RepID=UPI0006FA5EDF|nr:MULTISPECIES: sulfite exporter TauE/SafE family protein [unclassified Aureimonas]KQT64478.1 hypothetical protein ASG62_05885 [Aureimonas sp. Leaf427]KQT81666.1 hypothetical protein ASG54_03165 [Aureimonas sp. Leaf460]